MSFLSCLPLFFLSLALPLPLLSSHTHTYTTCRTTWYPRLPGSWDAEETRWARCPRLWQGGGHVSPIPRNRVQHVVWEWVSELNHWYIATMASWKWRLHCVKLVSHFHRWACGVIMYTLWVETSLLLSSLIFSLLLFLLLYFLSLSLQPTSLFTSPSPPSFKI